MAPIKSQTGGNKMTFYCNWPFGMYAEWDGVTRGHTWIDWVREDNDLLIWIGRLHVVLALGPYIPSQPPAKPV